MTDAAAMAALAADPPAGLPDELEVVVGEVDDAPAVGA